MNTAAALKEILPYVRVFQGKSFVIKLGGEVCTEKYLDEVIRQVSVMHHIGIRIALVHGGSPQLNRLQDRLGITSEVVKGRRITSEETLDCAKMVFAGQVNTEIVANLRKYGVTAVGLTGNDGGLITAHRRPPTLVEDGDDERVVDFGQVGDIENVNTSLLEQLLDSDAVPVVCALGGGNEGEIFNINADTIASRLSQDMLAEKLIVLTNVRGLRSDPSDENSLISYADIHTLIRMISDGSVQGGMLPKVMACIDAVRNGVARTHILDGTAEDALLRECFENEGCGTLIVSKKEKLRYELESGLNSTHVD